MPYYFVRHGQTDWNKEKRLQGIRDIPLNETGLNQARELRKQVEQNNLFFDKVYTSPLTRAVVTAEMVSNKSRTDKRNTHHNYINTQEDYHWMGIFFLYFFNVSISKI